MKQQQNNIPDAHLLAYTDIVVRQLFLLDQASNSEELGQAINTLLRTIGTYTQSERAYVFEWLSPAHDCFYNTYEWCAPGVAPQIHLLNRIEVTSMGYWMSQFAQDKAVVIEDLEAAKSLMPEEYKILKPQGIHSLIVFPIIANHKLLGFVGLDNPGLGTDSAYIRLLPAVGSHWGSMQENLRKTEALEREKHILDALCIDYTSVYYCDLLNDTIFPVKAGAQSNSDEIDRALGADARCFSKWVQHFFQHYVLPDSRQDLAELFQPKALLQRLPQEPRIAYRFHVRPNASHREYFDVQLVRVNAPSGVHAVLGFRYTDDLVAADERNRMMLEQALNSARLNNEIISALGKLYWRAYRLDLLTDTFEEVSTGEETHRLTGQSGQTSTHFPNACRNTVSDEYLPSMLAFLDTSTLADRMRLQDTISQEYLTRFGNWHVGSFVAQKRSKTGRVTNALYVIRIINEQKQQEIEYEKRLKHAAEDAQRANLAKSDFLRRMSHDIRTPINGIQGMLEIAKHYPNDLKKQQECREKIMEASGYLLSLVSSILDMTKLESGSVLLEHKPFDLEQVLKEANTVAQMQAIEYGLRFASVRKPGQIQHPHLIGSPVHLKQILENLASNAIKYSKKNGQVTVYTKELSYNESTALFQFVCEDNGIGMSPEFQQRLFEPFTQEKRNDARTRYPGSGLGLSIVKALTERMGGTISFTSREGVGTTFTVTLPFVINPDLPQTLPSPDSGAPFRADGASALLVEDNDLNLEIAQFLLEQTGIRVVTARNGQEAVDCFAASAPGTFDLIFMDIMMPVMSGLEAARAIRAMDRPDAQTVPIIAMSANAFTDDIQSSLAAGMNEHLAKPLESRSLFRVMRRYLHA